MTAASKHGISVEVIERDEHGIATVWLGTCDCKSRFSGATHAETEDKWRAHVHSITGTAPRPMGDKTGRWMP